MKILAIANQKGGSAKTTLAFHLAYAAQDANKRVLLVDLDPQGSLSLSFNQAEGAEEGSPASLLFAENPAIQPENLGENLSILRADGRLHQLGGQNRDAMTRPRNTLRKLASDYDLIIIDTPGALGFNPPMTIAALIAADAVICPFAVGLYEGQGLADLWRYLRNIKQEGWNPALRLLGLLPCRINTKSSEERQALESLRKQFGHIILPITLGDRAAVKQAVMRKRAVWKGTKGQGHLAAAKEWKAACLAVLRAVGVTEKQEIANHG